MSEMKGGKPSRTTPADRRLSENRNLPAKPKAPAPASAPAKSPKKR